MKVIGFGDFKQKRTGSDFDDLTTFTTGGNEFYKFSLFPEHFQEIVDHEVKDERRLLLKNGSVLILNNTGKDMQVSFD